MRHYQYLMIGGGMAADSKQRPIHTQVLSESITRPTLWQSKRHKFFLDTFRIQFRGLQIQGHKGR